MATNYEISYVRTENEHQAIHQQETTQEGTPRTNPIVMGSFKGKDFLARALDVKEFQKNNEILRQKKTNLIPPEDYFQMVETEEEIRPGRKKAKWIQQATPSKDDSGDEDHDVIFRAPPKLQRTPPSSPAQSPARRCAKENEEQSITVRVIEDKIEELRTVLGGKYTSVPTEANEVVSCFSEIIVRNKLRLTKENMIELFKGVYSVYDLLKEKENTIKEQERRIKKLEEELQKVKETQPDPPRSYAHAAYAHVARNTVAPRPALRIAPRKAPPITELPKTVIIEPKDPKVPIKEVRETLAKECSPTKQGLNILKTTITRTNKMIVQCKAQADVQKLMTLAKEKESLSAIKFSEAKKLRPRLIIKQAPANYRTEDITAAILQQNHLDFTTNDLKPIFSFPLGQGRHWIMETSKELYYVLLQKKKIFLGFKACKVEGYLKPNACHKCHRFGHIQSKCPEAVKRCSKCWGEHLVKDCPKDAAPSCINCSERNSKTGKQTPTNHTSTDSNCPCYVFQITRLRDQTDY